MATFRELLTDVPTQISEVMARSERERVEREVLRRKAASYQKRMAALSEEENVFGKCKGVRPKKRWHNYVSTEKAGRVGMRIREVRFPSAVVVCKTRNLY